MDEDEIRNKIKELIIEFFSMKKEKDKFISGKTYIHYAPAVFDENEINAMVQSILDCWFGLGKKGEEFEKEFADYIGSKYAVLTNSGSSANLLAVSTLCADSISKLKPGDEVMTPSVNFPTTFNPIVQNRLIPVIVDVKLGNYNIDETRIEKAISDRTKMIMIPHTLGNPNNMDVIIEIAERHNLIVLEDNCDALGSSYKNKKTGSFGLLSTCSFYPAHHVTMGEGGIVAINSDDLNLERTVRSIRDWGRACYCRLDEKNPNGTCNSRFNFLVNGIKYDHKYVSTNIGYNLKPLEFQAAFGLVQLKRIEDFKRAREKNFNLLFDGLREFDDVFILPEQTPDSIPSWFSFPITLRDGVSFSRKDIVEFLENNKIQARLLFAGNIIHQPAYKNVDVRIYGDLKNADKIMKDTFFVGLSPGISEEKIMYMIFKFKEFIQKYKR